MVAVPCARVFLDSGSALLTIARDLVLVPAITSAPNPEVHPRTRLPEHAGCFGHQVPEVRRAEARRSW